MPHVLQQREGRVSPTKQGKGVAYNNPSLEQEADVRGKLAAKGESASKDSTIQRSSDNEAVQM